MEDSILIDWAGRLVDLNTGDHMHIGKTRRVPMDMSYHNQIKSEAGDWAVLREQIITNALSTF